MTAAVIGLDATLVEVESDISNGLPNTIIVGLPDASVQESKERVKLALRNSGLHYPYTRVSVNLAPADVPKVGTHYDLPIALSILLASGQLDFDTNRSLFIGELSLDGQLRSTDGVLAIALQAQASGFAKLFVPEANAAEAALVRSLAVYPVTSLGQLLRHLTEVEQLPRAVSINHRYVSEPSVEVDFKDIAGQDLAKRAAEIACAGGHNVLFRGPPGSGKTLLARAMAGLLPELTFSEALEITKIYSIAGQLTDSLVSHRPVRSPHHTISRMALIGGGSLPRPGEITLAHRGILFLDECAEFPRSVLEALRQPLEDGHVTISRARRSLVFPTKFILVTALNPCPCGYYSDPEKSCICTPGQIFSYQKKISGPLLDRIDLHVAVPRLPYEKMMQQTTTEDSFAVRVRVEQARTIQYQRFDQAKTNGEMSSAELRHFCRLDEAGHAMLKIAAKQYILSGRGIHRVLKVARTIADLANSEHIIVDHVAEALQYRAKSD